jgi:hypothetical protein
VQDAPASQNLVLQDGTMQVAGYFAHANGARDARTSLFDVQSSAVWRQYSEIDQTSGATYFAALAKTGTGNPRTLVDAGHLVLNAVSTLNLAGTLQGTPGTGGRGAEVDVSGLNIQILASGETASDGHLGIDASQLTDLGAESILIGGVRTEDASGNSILAAANSIEIKNGAYKDADGNDHPATPLEAAQIMLVTANQGTAAANGDDTITLDAGSVLAV